LPAAEDNPGGFYEASQVVAVNHNLLLAAGSGWNFCLNFEPEIIVEALQPSHRAIIAQILRREFGDAPGFVLKDPRLCLTLPAWMPVLRDDGIDVSTLIIVRHPAAVVRSIERRNHLPEDQTAANWLHHMLEAERSSRRLKRAIIFYEDFVRDWRRCITAAGRVAGIVWPRTIEEAAPEIDRFLVPAPAHVGSSPVRDMVNAVWGALGRLSHDPGSYFDLAHLDDLRTQFAVWRRQVMPPGTRVVFPAI
jgi:hypothetical protein